MKPDYTGKKILFTAFSVAEGSEELAGYEYIKKHGATDISTLYWGGMEVELKIPEDVKKIEVDGNNQFDAALTEGYDLVFRHQTTRPDLIKSPSTTNTNEFFKYCPAEIIAITGTKGKGTTATLISEILDVAGVENRLLGNMGNTAIQVLDEIQPHEVVVFEISSFQLWDLEYSPHVAVVLMMSVDHQDIHTSVEDYVLAKSNIVKHQTIDDIAIHHPTNELTQQVITHAQGRTRKYMEAAGAHIIEDQLFIDTQFVMKTSEVGLRGKHNLENVCAAVTAAWEYTKDIDSIAKAVRQFAGLEHRLETVREFNNVEFVNDSFSVVPIATIAAVQAFSKPVYLLAGGFYRGQDFSEMAEAIAHANVAKVFTYGDSRSRIADALFEHQYTEVEVVENANMKELVEKARAAAIEHSIVLLSPGCASFDMFNNYKERGQVFKSVVLSL